MKFLSRCALLAASCTLAAAAWAQPVTVADVKYDETTSVGGSTLLLNGAGVRYKAVFKVYTAGLYLEKKTAIVTTVATHEYTLGIQDTMLQQVVFWIRLENEELYEKWKNHFLTVNREDTTASEPVQRKASMTSPANPLEPFGGSFVKEFAASLARSSEYDASIGPSGDADQLAALAVVKAVEAASRDFSRQIEAQSTSYLRKSGLLQSLRSGNLEESATSKAFLQSFAPVPSEQKMRVHPAVRWDKRVQELMTVMSTGAPVNLPVKKGEMWFVIDATWFKHWICFVSSSRRMSPPGPIDNLWMINPLTDRPYEQIIEDTDLRQGDFRRVPPQAIPLMHVEYVC